MKTRKHLLLSQGCNAQNEVPDLEGNEIKRKDTPRNFSLMSVRSSIGEKDNNNDIHRGFDTTKPRGERNHATGTGSESDFDHYIIVYDRVGRSCSEVNRGSICDSGVVTPAPKPPSRTAVYNQIVRACLEDKVRSPIASLIHRQLYLPGRPE